MKETATAMASSRHVRSLLAATPTFASEFGSLGALPAFAAGAVALVTVVARVRTA